MSQMSIGKVETSTIITTMKIPHPGYSSFAVHVFDPALSPKGFYKRNKTLLQQAFVLHHIRKAF